MWSIRGSSDESLKNRMRGFDFLSEALAVKAKKPTRLQQAFLNIATR